jgi:Cytochrome c7 and related cytochrome c
VKKLFFLVLLCISFNVFAGDSCEAARVIHPPGILQRAPHYQCQCSTCHKGNFKEAPKVCSGCHVASGRANTAKSIKHIPTTAECNTCHISGSTWVPTKMQHSQTQSSCETCHSGGYTSQGAKAKNSEHIPTTSTCSTCHTTSSWDANFRHQGVVAGSCSTCHNGTYAKGKNTNHIPTSTSCDTCHLNYNSFSGATMNHLGIVADCATCHNGILATGKPPGHLEPTPKCEVCHTSSGNKWICNTGKLELYIKQIYAQFLEVFA